VSRKNTGAQKCVIQRVKNSGIVVVAANHRRRIRDDSLKSFLLFTIEVCPWTSPAIQAALRERNIDAWLFYDHHHRDPIAYRVLGLPRT
jgi:hypothetical protein